MATGPEQWDVCFVCAGLADQNIYRRGGGTVFPLHLAKDEHSLGLDDSRLNFSQNLIKKFAGFSATPEHIFNYAYAVFHSPRYRSRYAEFLKIDFPRLPLTSSLDLFRALTKLGGELVALHLMESPKLDKQITKWIGGKNPEVEKVTYFDETVWTDKTQTEGFRGVPETVWNFHIGGYKVCEKWLKDRKGRTLTAADIAHYHRIITALCETIRLMREIDEVIEEHGGWPNVFTNA
jgi:predicted helicase